MKIPPRPPGYAFVEVCPDIICGHEGVFLSCFSHFFSCLIYVEHNNLQFEDPRDAEDAIRYRDGYNFDGFRLRVSTISFLPFYFSGAYATFSNVL